MSDYLLRKINEIVNDASTTWKVKRALLRHLGLNEITIDELVPKEES